MQLIGKGRKERAVPLWQETTRVLKAWFEELGDDTGQIAFPNARGKALSREGVDYLLSAEPKIFLHLSPNFGSVML